MMKDECDIENLNPRKTPYFNMPEVIPEPEELEALRAGREDRAVNGTISHEAINWD